MVEKPKKGEPGYVCECKLCRQHRELKRIMTLLPEEDAKKLEDMWCDIDHRNFDLEWEIFSLDDRWNVKYDELSSRLENVALI